MSMPPLPPRAPLPLLPFRLSFVIVVEEEDDEFGWGDDQEDDDHHDNNDRSTSVGAGGGPAGGALGAMRVPSSSFSGAAAAVDGVGRSLGISSSSSTSAAAGGGGRGDPLVGQSSAGSGSGAEAGTEVGAETGASPSSSLMAASGGVKSLVSTAAAAEIARLTEALRACEMERASLGEKLKAVRQDSGDGEGSESLTAELRRERDAAVAEVGERGPGARGGG